MDTSVMNEPDSGKINIFGNTKTALTPAAEPISVPKGQLRFDNLANGLYLHSCDHKATESRSHSVEIEPGLSFNLLIEGELNFSIGQRTYRLNADEKPLLFCSVLNEKEIFTRFLIQGQRVKKVNVAVGKSWLIERVYCDNDKAWLNNVFSTSQVYTLPHCDVTYELANTILGLDENKDMSCALSSESFGTKMFANCLQHLRQSRGKLIDVNPSVKADIQKEQCAIKTFIEENIHQRLTITSISERFALSASTLQRRFRERHHISVSQYVKKRRLEVAKKALLIENLSIGEVAFNAGYNHVSNFNHAFSKQFKLSPARYRKQHTNN